MDVSKPKYAKTLKEHLQQQQEPFSLQNYIIERSYMFKNCNSDSSNSHGLYSTKNLKWSIKYDLHKIRKRLLHATGTLRSLLYKFSAWDEERNGDQYYVNEVTAGTQATQQTDYLFPLKSLAASDYFANSDVEGKVLPYEHHSSTLVNMFQTFTTLPTLRTPEVDTGYRPYWISSKEIKQEHIRGSEWKEPLPNAVGHLRSPEAPVTSLPALSQKTTYLRKLLLNSNILKLRRPKKDKLHEMAGTTSPCRGNKRLLQKRGQLPFECVEKGREFYFSEDKSLSIKADSKSEEFGSVIHERFSFLEKQCREVRKIANLLYTESSEEWKNLQIVNRGEVLMEIGDAILNDIVRELTDSLWF